MSSDPFAELGLPRIYGLAAADVHRAYLTHSRTLHPDMAGMDPDAAAAAASLNEAKRVLDNPELRANALLGLLGGPAKEQDRSLPPGFLAEMLEKGEQIEAVCRSGDRSRIALLLEWAAGQRRARQEAVTGLFGTIGNPANPTVLKTIRGELNAWRYIERLMEQLDRGQRE